MKKIAIRASNMGTRCRARPAAQNHLIIHKFAIILANRAFRLLVKRMVFEHIPHIAVQPNVVEEVVALKNPVVLHHPQVCFTDKRLQNRRRNVRMVERAQCVANVV